MSTELATRNVHTEPEKRQAMVVYASQHGRRDQVEKMLAELGLGRIKYGTLRTWVGRDRKDEYLQIKAEYDAYVRSQMSDQYRTVASQALENSSEIQRQLGEALREGEVPVRELPRAGREAVTTAGIATDKGELLSGNPTSVVKTDVAEVKQELAAVGIQIIVGGGQPPTALPAPARQDQPSHSEEGDHPDAAPEDPGPDVLPADQSR